MSKILIISNHWMEEDLDENGKPLPMPASLFKEKRTYNGKMSATKNIFAQVLLELYISVSEKSTEIYNLLGLEDTDDAIPTLCSLAQKILDETNFCNEIKQKYYQEDIKSSNKDNLEADLYEALQHTKENEELQNVFVSVISAQHPPICYFKSENNEEYKIIGISSLPYDLAGIDFCQKWMDALIEDFSQKDDHVILALHGSTDWSAEDPVLGPCVDFSEKLSKSKNRDLKIFLFHHDGSDCIAKVLKSDTISLAKIWNQIEDAYGRK